MDMMRATQPNTIGCKPGVTNYRNRGFSLVEIMVVLVILLIGILAVVRIFPPGFLSIAKTAEMTVADALNRQQLDAQKRANNQMEAIYATDWNNNVLSTVLPSDISDVNASTLLGADPFYFSNVDKIRNIMGESFRVPVPTSNTGLGYGAIYPLQFGPVENSFSGSTDKILVYGTGLQRTAQSAVKTPGNPTGTAVLRNESEYAIDYDNMVIAFQPRLINASRPVAYRQFTVSYDYYYLNTTTNTIGIQFQPNMYDPTDSISTIITVPDVAPTVTGTVPPPVWQPIFAGSYSPDPVVAAGYTGMALPSAPPIYLNGFPPATNASFTYGIVRDSEEVSRKFRLALTGTTVEAGGVPTWSSQDPYEYAWYSQQNPANTANPGILIFNPSGHNQVQVASGVAQPLSARVDYRIFDNHVIRDDRNIPASAPYIVTLSVPFLKLGGDVLDNQNPLNNFNSALNPYNGLYRDPLNPTPDVIIYNASTGVQVGTWTNLATPPGIGVLTKDATDTVPVDQKTGVLTLNQAQVESNNLQSAPLRVMYRAQRDWGMQIQKATAHYREATAPTFVDFRHYYIGDGTTGGATRIYFAPCDAGKTVEIGEFYSTTSSTPIRNQSFQITEDPTQFDTTVSPPLPYIDVTSITGGAGFSAVQTGRRVNNVQGISIKARVVWEDSLRWRHVDNDSVLIQAPSQ